MSAVGVIVWRGQDGFPDRPYRRFQVPRLPGALEPCPQGDTEVGQVFRTFGMVMWSAQYGAQYRVHRLVQICEPFRAPVPRMQCGTEG